MGASAFLKSVDFTAFAVNVKTIARGKYLYQFGHAIWWGTLPQPVFTFLEEYDFSGKTILPLCTHEGSRLGRSESDIASICPDAQLLDGLSVRGSDAGSAQTEVEEWSSNSGMLE